MYSKFISRYLSLLYATSFNISRVINQCENLKDNLISLYDELYFSPKVSSCITYTILYIIVETLWKRFPLFVLGYLCAYTPVVYVTIKSNESTYFNHKIDQTFLIKFCKERTDLLPCGK